MSNTVTPSAPKPVEASGKPPEPGARAQDRKGEAGDIFANLLNLLASTQVLPEATTVARAALNDSATDENDAQKGTDNPLTALMGLGVLGAADAALGKRSGVQGADSSTGLPGSARSADRLTAGAGQETLASGGQIDISDMTPVEPAPMDIPPKGSAALPANAVRPGAAYLPTARATDGVNPSTATTPWRHASAASTETVALQQTAQTALATQVRSTVALNDRFGLTPGVPLARTDTREATADTFSLPTAVGAGNRAADATPAMPTTATGEAATGSDGSGSDASTFDHTDGQADNPFADAATGEEPTVTHWGTQHLRHASLRVGGEEGEQAIDIQLSMKGQEVQVEFKTDSAEARASLRESAGDSLGDLLSRSGIQLGGVSVGAQGQPGSRGEASSTRHNGVRGLASAPEATLPATTSAQPAIRADGSRPLDVFA